MHYVFFPIDSFISLITQIDGHAGLEVGLVGDEGMVGTSLMLGVNAAPLRAVVQGAGAAWRMEASIFCRELARGPALRLGMNGYVYVTLRQRKLIRYSRGELTILNGRGLETAACGCYAAAKVTHATVLGGRVA